MPEHTLVTWARALGCADPAQQARIQSAGEAMDAAVAAALAASPETAEAQFADATEQVSRGQREVFGGGLHPGTSPYFDGQQRVLYAEATRRWGPDQLVVTPAPVSPVTPDPRRPWA